MTKPTAMSKPTASEVFLLVHAGHDIQRVIVVYGLDAPPLICWTCHAEQHPEIAEPTGC